MLPGLCARQRLHDMGDEPLAELDVLRVLLGRSGVVGVDEGELGQAPGGDSGVEMIEGADPVGAGGVSGVHDDQARLVLVVDGPVDAVGVEAVEDRASRRRAGLARVVDRARRRAGEEVRAVGERLGEHRGEVALADREVLRERVGERDVALVPEAHGDRRARRDEAVVAAVVVGLVARVPRLAGLAVELAGGGGVLGRHRVAARVRVGVDRSAASDRQPVHRSPAGDLVRNHPEQVVERVVLHHQHDDVLDLVHARAAGGPVRGTGGSRAGAGRRDAPPGGPRRASRGWRAGRRHRRRRRAACGG